MEQQEKLEADIAALGGVTDDAEELVAHAETIESSEELEEKDDAVQGKETSEETNEEVSEGQEEVVEEEEGEEKAEVSDIESKLIDAVLGQLTPESLGEGQKLPKEVTERLEAITQKIDQLVSERKDDSDAATKPLVTEEEYEEATSSVDGFNKVLNKAVSRSYETVLERLPNVIQSHVQEQVRATIDSHMFYAKHEDLAPHREAVVLSVQLVHQANPEKPREWVMARGADLARAVLRKKGLLKTKKRQKKANFAPAGGAAARPPGKTKQQELEEQLADEIEKMGKA